MPAQYNYASYDIDADSDNFESVFSNDQLTYRWYVWTSESDSNNNALADENEYILKNQDFPNDADGDGDNKFNFSYEEGIYEIKLEVEDQSEQMVQIIFKCAQ